MLKKITAIVLLGLIITVISISCAGSNTTELDLMKFGTLPVMQALPLFVAESKGYFAEEKLNVELISFNTAADKDIALSTGNIDGQFADLFTPAMIEQNGQNIEIVASNYSTKNDRRMFGVLASPQSNIKTAAELKNVPIALSSNTVIHYVTEKLLVDSGVLLNDIEYVETKNIGIRMQMLLSGQVKAATLPEPLVSAALAAGATLIADDSGLSTSQTVLLFSRKYIDNNPETVRAFLRAVAKASEFINQHSDSARAVMVEKVRVPEPLKQSYPMPRFPKLRVPAESDIVEVLYWFENRDVISVELNYAALVEDGYIKADD